MRKILIRILALFVTFVLLGCAAKDNKYDSSSREEIRTTDQNSEFAIEYDFDSSQVGEDRTNLMDNSHKEYEIANLGFITSRNINSFECDKCSSSLLREFFKVMDSANYQTLYNLICTIDKRCENNIEFSQFSNELLFKALLRYPEDMVLILSNEDLFSNYLEYYLQSPLVAEQYEIDTICQRISNVQSNGGVKDKLLSILCNP